MGGGEGGGGTFGGMLLHGLWPHAGRALTLGPESRCGLFFVVYLLLSFGVRGHSTVTEHMPVWPNTCWRSQQRGEPDISCPLARLTRWSPEVDAGVRAGFRNVAVLCVAVLLSTHGTERVSLSPNGGVAEALRAGLAASLSLLSPPCSGDALSPSCCGTKQYCGCPLPVQDCC